MSINTQGQKLGTWDYAGKASPAPAAFSISGSFVNQLWQVQCPSAGSGFLYTLERSLDLQSWAPIASTISSAYIPIVLQDSNPPTAQAFYRVSVQ